MNTHNRFILLGPIILLFLLLTVSRVFSSPTYYTMRRGDTLYSVARRFDVALDRLIEVNGISDPTRVRVGTVLLIPAGGLSSDGTREAGQAAGEGEFFLYTVRRGDTLYGIARRFDVGLSDLLAANGLSSNGVIKPGQRLRVPGAPGAQRAVDGGDPDAGDPAGRDDRNAGGGEAADRPPDGGNPDKRGVPFWPHPGEISRLGGKLSSAVAILGREGDTVISVSSGRVMWAGPFRGFGRMAFVKAASGFVYGYGGNRSLSVKVGDRVGIGSEIGHLGVNAHDGVAKVFFFVTKDGKPLEPARAPRS